MTITKLDIQLLVDIVPNMNLIQSC